MNDYDYTISSIFQLMTTLSELFMVGDLLPCKVMECETGNKNIKLSLNPADVNESMIPGSIRNGMVRFALHREKTCLWGF